MMTWVRRWSSLPDSIAAKYIGTGTGIDVLTGTCLVSTIQY